MPWRELEHPADIRLEIEAEGLEELVKECACAFYSVTLGAVPGKAGQESPGEISVSAGEGDFEGLLVTWMNELLFHLENSGRVFIPGMVEIAESRGELVAHGGWSAAPCPGGRVKAVTYGGLEFDQGPPWRLRVIMDI